MPLHIHSGFILMAITPVDAIEQWTDLIAPFAGPLRLDAVAIGAAAADVVQSYPRMDQPIRRFGTFVRDDHLSGLGLDLQEAVFHKKENSAIPAEVLPVSRFRANHSTIPDISHFPAQLAVTEPGLTLYMRSGQRRAKAA